MARTMTLTPGDQKRRRRRNRITLQQIADRLECSVSSVSEYENEIDPLPWELTPDDYERELQVLIAERAKGVVA
jgi:transcriptional regulator with XRE-family HTH domain